MSEYHIDGNKKPLSEWTPVQLAAYLKSRGCDQDYAELFIEQNVSGKIAHRLTDSDLKEMGITKVGDRLEIMQALEAIRKAQQKQENDKLLWSGQEVLYFSWWDQCCQTCCGCCPKDPNQYKLTRTQLEIKTFHNNRCGPIKCCCGHGYDIDLMDISNIKDVDVKGVPPNCLTMTCCCGKSQEHITIRTNDGNDTTSTARVLVLNQKQGHEVALKIRSQVESMQRMERN